MTEVVARWASKHEICDSSPVRGRGSQLKLEIEGFGRRRLVGVDDVSDAWSSD